MRGPMSVRSIAAVSLGIMASAATGAQTQSAAGASASAADAGIASFSAHYQADWKSISVGTSDLELRNDTEPGHYVYTWTITARGIFRVVYHDDLIQKSWFSINDGHVRPA